MDFGLTSSAGPDGQRGTAMRPIDRFPVQLSLTARIPQLRARPTSYNFGPINYYQRPDTRYSSARWVTTSWRRIADVYTQLMFSDYESVAQIAPGGVFFDTNDHQLRQPVAVGSAAGDARLRCRGGLRRATIIVPALYLVAAQRGRRSAV